ncbi:MAG: diguanylate cyclase domain-containing protein [Pseudomonadota bacterium]
MIDRNALRWHRLVEPAFLFPAIGILLLILVWSALYNVVRTERVAAVRSHRITAADLVTTYEAQVVRALRELEFTVSLVNYTAQSRTVDQTLAELERHELLPPSLLFAVSILDAQGRIIASTDDAPDGEMASTPALPVPALPLPVSLHYARHDTQSDRWWIDISATLQEPLDARADRVVVSVDATYFVSSYEDERLGQLGSLGVVTADQVLLAARVSDQLLYGGEAPVEQWLTAAGEGEVSVHDSPIDEELRYIAVRSVFGWPLFLVTGLSVDEQMAPVNAATRRSVWASIGVSAVLMVLMALLGRMSQQLHRSRALLLQQRMAQAEEAEYRALHDDLTGLPNRSLYSQLLGARIRESRRDGTAFAVMFLDLDRFKQVNDTLGHEAGDLLLQEASGRILEALRDSDVLARMGGDEFVILLRSVSDRRALEEVAERLLRAVSRPYQLTGHVVSISASIGISCYPRDGEDEQTLLKHADDAMYRAKQEGRNAFRFHGDPPTG